MQLTTLRRLLIDELQEIYISESLIEDALPRMEKGADSPDLKAVFTKHLEQTKGHTERLDQVFELLEESPRGGHGFSVKALIRETEDRMGEGGDPHVVDASLIAAGRRLEHWEIASYSSSHKFALAMGLPKVADLLARTLEEEKAADERLSSIGDEVRVVDTPSPK